jgi:hypothetical protein
MSQNGYQALMSDQSKANISKNYKNEIVERLKHL